MDLRRITAEASIIGLLTRITHYVIITSAKPQLKSYKVMSKLSPQIKHKCSLNLCETFILVALARKSTIRVQSFDTRLFQDVIKRNSQLFSYIKLRTWHQIKVLLQSYNKKNLNVNYRGTYNNDIFSPWCILDDIRNWESFLDSKLILWRYTYCLGMEASKYITTVMEVSHDVTVQHHSN